MKKNIKLSMATFSLILITIGLITLTSCGKSSSNNVNFNGTYYGTLIVSGVITEADTIVITSGSTSSSVVMNSKTSRGSSYTVNGTVSGNTLNVPSQQVYVASLSTTYTVTGSGSLVGSTLKVNESWSGNSLNFTGTRQ